MIFLVREWKYFSILLSHRGNFVFKNTYFSRFSCRYLKWREKFRKVASKRFPDDSSTAKFRLLSQLVLHHCTCFLGSLVLNLAEIGKEVRILCNFLFSEKLTVL